MLSTVAPFLLLLSRLSLADSKPVGEKSSSGSSSNDFTVGSMGLPQQPFVLANTPSHNAHHRPATHVDASLYDNIVLNGDFATGDASGWSVESAAVHETWNTHVELTSASAASGEAQTRRMALNVTVPAESYVMMFQDIDYNSTSTFILPSGLSKEGADMAAKNTDVAHTAAHTIPFAKDDAYTLTFDYRFAASCAAGSSLYYGVVSAEDLVDLEGDLGVEEKSEDAGVEGWKSFRGTVKASTEWGSLYLYFMTKEGGPCGFEVADVGVFRVWVGAEEGREL